MAPYSGQLDHTSFVDALLGGEYRTQAVDRCVHRFAEIKILKDGSEEIGLLAVAEFLMIGLVLHCEDLVLMDEALVACRDLDTARAIVDRIAVMDNGRIVEMSTPAQLLESPQHDTTKRLVAAALPEIGIVPIF